MREQVGDDVVQQAHEVGDALGCGLGGGGRGEAVRAGGGVVGLVPGWKHATAGTAEIRQAGGGASWKARQLPELGTLE